MAASAAKVFVCLNIQKQDHLLDVRQLVAAAYSQPPEKAKGRGGMPEAELRGARRDFALLSLLMGNDYLPTVKSGELKRVFPIYLKLRKGFSRRSLVLLAEDKAGGKSRPSVRIDWAMFLELISRCAGRGGAKEEAQVIAHERIDVPPAQADDAVARLSVAR